MCPDRHELGNITSAKKHKVTTEKEKQKKNKCNIIQKRKRVYQIKSSNEKTIPSQSLPIHYNNMSTLSHLEPALRISISKEYMVLLSCT